MGWNKIYKSFNFILKCKGSSINDLTVLGEGVGQGFCDNSTRSLVKKHEYGCIGWQKMTKKCKNYGRPLSERYKNIFICNFHTSMSRNDGTFCYLQSKLAVDQNDQKPVIYNHCEVPITDWLYIYRKDHNPQS